MSSGSKKKQIHDISKRNSIVSKTYDDLIGSSLEKLSVKTLPCKRDLIKRWRYMKEQDTCLQIRQISKILAGEVIHIWNRTKVPQKGSNAVAVCIQRQLNKFKYTKIASRQESDFQDELDSLFDIRPQEFMNEDKLRKELASKCGDRFEEEFDFFKRHLEKGVFKGAIAPAKDKILDNKEVKREERQMKRERFLKSQGVEEQQEVITPPISKRCRDLEAISSQQQNVVEPRRRRLSLNYAENDDEDSDSTDVHDEWQPSSYMKRKLSLPDSDVTIKLPRKNIPSLLASTSTTTRTSLRQEMKLTSTLLKAGGVDLNEISYSTPTIYRQRKSTVKETASAIKEKILGDKDTNRFLVVHYDGKIVKSLSGRKEDRIAVCVTSPDLKEDMFLGSPVVTSSVGKEMADAVHNVLDSMDMCNEVEALVFDTTSSNSGIHKGSVVLLQEKLKHPIMSLACRHHVAELAIKHASRSVRGPTKGPDDELFKKLKSQYEQLGECSPNSYWKWPSENNVRQALAQKVLDWSSIQMTKEWPKNDYRELIELVHVYLSGKPTIQRRRGDGKVVTLDFKLQKPGAVHQARFMASCLYILKIALLGEQLSMKKRQRCEIEALAEFVALLYAPYYLTSSLTTAAPRIDRDFISDLLKYQSCFAKRSREDKMVDAALNSQMKHSWYLTDENVTFSLFDDHLCSEEKTNLAKALIKIEKPGFELSTPKFPEPSLLMANPSLDLFLGERSWMIFEKMQSDGSWLEAPVESWPMDPDYVRMKERVDKISVVNDPAERVVKDIQEYVLLTNDPVYRDEIITVSRSERRKLGKARKLDMNKNR